MDFDIHFLLQVICTAEEQHQPVSRLVCMRDTTTICIGMACSALQHGHCKYFPCKNAVLESERWTFCLRILCKSLIHLV